GATLCVRDYVLHAGNRQTLAHAGTLVDFLVLAGSKGNALDDLLHVFWDVQLVSVALRPGFLRRDGDTLFDGRRVMRANFRANTVLQRSNDFAAGGVILRVGAENERDIERQADGVALNLYIALLHDVEQSNLNFSREVRQFVNGEDAAIGAGQQSVVDSHLATQFVAAPRRFDGIDVANQVGDSHIRRGQLFDIALFLREIRDGRLVAKLRHPVPAAAADGRIRIVVNLAACNVGHLCVQQGGESSQDAALSLAAES